jgi:hypothetical protein
MRTHLAAAALLLLGSGPVMAGGQGEDKGWIVLFNGTDTSGWRLRSEKVAVTRFYGADGKELVGAKKGKVDQKEMIQDLKGMPVPGARIEVRNNRKVVVDADGRLLMTARVVKVGGRDAVVDRDGNEVVGATAKTTQEPNPSGWAVANGELVCARPHGGNDLLTERKFTDFELHVEFQATGNSGVYLQGRYEIQIDNSHGARPKLVERDGKPVAELSRFQCGAVYGRVAPSKNMARPAKEWQTFRVAFRAARGEKGKVAQKARVTLEWNGETVIDAAEIDGPTGGALDGKVTEPGPLLLQGDHGRVSFRNIRIRELK